MVRVTGSPGSKARTGNDGARPRVLNVGRREVGDEPHGLVRLPALEPVSQLRRRLEVAGKLCTYAATLRLGSV
jgi:hypothetical protein